MTRWARRGCSQFAFMALVATLGLLLAQASWAQSGAPATKAQPAAAPASPSKGDSMFAAIAADTAKQLPTVVALPGTLPPDLARSDAEDFAAYVKWQRQFARESWDWHLFSTKLLMGAVLIIVLAGLFFTYLQFSHGGSAPTPRLPAKTPASPPASVVESVEDVAIAGEPVARTLTTIKLNAAGLEMTSQVIGLLVLGLSLAFFYFYVKIVYPMQEVELQRQANTAAAAATPSPSPGEKPPP
jgi:hypothetical protein